MKRFVIIYLVRVLCVRTGSLQVCEDGNAGLCGPSLDSLKCHPKGVGRVLISGVAFVVVYFKECQERIWNTLK